MARQHKLPPSASSLSASLRDIGYSLETAVADLIDNSISAGAAKIEIFCIATRNHPVLAVIDNGKGMNDKEIIAAMKHGSMSPAQKRDPDDLGRFGLGLKTASFSQCRRLTVTSARKGQLCSAEWDLDLVNKEDDWMLSILDKDEIEKLPFIDKINSEGTIVLWRKLDRLFEDETGKRRDEIVNEKLDILGKHLSLVFHRFLSGEVKGRKKISIAVNGHGIEPFDPFYSGHLATQRLPRETVRIDDAVVTMQPFILPHHSKLTAKEYDHHRNRSDFISDQGAYIYRNGRLMAWGGWFRLIPKGEATKLARVQIDFPNSLDGKWTIDIKKSRARPPRQVRERLKQVIDRITSRSITVHRGRGKKLFDEIEAPVWERYADRGAIRYSINREHPLVQSLSDGLEDDADAGLEMLLDAVSSSLPVEMIYSDYSTHPKDMQQFQEDEDALIEKLKLLKNMLTDGNKINADAFREIIRSTRMFDACTEVVEKFIKEELR